MILSLAYVTRPSVGETIIFLGVNDNLLGERLKKNRIRL